MYIVAACAGFAVVESALGDGGISAIVAAAAIVGALAAEAVVFLLTKRQTMKDGSAVASALIFTLLLPNQIHPAIAAAGAFFAILVIKASAGGLGANWLNPALGGFLFVRASWPDQVAAALSHSPLAAADALETASSFEISPYASSVIQFLNENIFSLVDVHFPENYSALLFLNAPSIIGDRAVPALLASAIVLCAAKIIRVWPQVIYLLFYTFLVYALGGIDSAAVVPAAAAATVSVVRGDMFYILFSGGTIIASFFLLGDPATSAKSRGGILLIVIIAALFSFFFRVLHAEAYGAFYACILVNLITPMVRHLETKIFYQRRKIE
jgi:electron transport complex protein RnfD